MQGELPEQPTSGTELTMTQQILVRATELIKIKENWIKGGAYRSEGDDDMAKYCALGAIGKAQKELGIFEGSGSPLFHAVAKLVAGSADAVIRINDAANTTHEQIKELFCKAVNKELGNGTSNDNIDTSS